MTNTENENLRTVKQLGINLPCYFYGYFKSPGLSNYPDLAWVNDDYNLIKTKHLDAVNCQRIANNLFVVGNKFKIFDQLDYLIMMPLKATSISSLEQIIIELVKLINKHNNKQVTFINQLFLVADYRKFWENKLTTAQRKAEIANKIVLKPEYDNFFVHKNVLIIDDVVSTGTSIADVAKILFAKNNHMNLIALCYGSVYHWAEIY